MFSIILIIIWVLLNASVLASEFMWNTQVADWRAMILFSALSGAGFLGFYKISLWIVSLITG